MKLKEALDLPFGGKYMHPDKQRYVENLPSHEKDVVTGMYPNLDGENMTYLELITSATYKSSVERLAKYLGLSLEAMHKKHPSFSSLYNIILTNYLGTVQAEANYKQELQVLAVETVLDLPEFKIIKEMVAAGMLKIDARLDVPDLRNAVTENELKSKNGKLSTSEKDTQQLATEFVKPQLDPEILAKRSFAKTFAQGNAVNKFYLFHLVEDRLKQINPQLPKMYGIVCAGTTMSYYGMPMIEMSKSFANSAAVGSAEVINDGEIKARGANFPILVHEIVKGIYNWLTYDVATQKELDRETLDQEVLELMSGQELYNIFLKQIKVKDQPLIPFIVKDLLQHPAEVIKKVNAGKAEAGKIMPLLVRRAKITYILYKFVDGDDDDLVPQIREKLMKMSENEIDVIYAGGEQAEDALQDVINNLQ